jgi:hypothetical protein
MIFHPGIMALLLGSVLSCLMLLYSAYFGVAIFRGWDIRSGSERQLGLERRTYLISTVVAYAFGFQLLSFFLFLFTADLLHPLFPGAMCAAGVLNVNRFGYPALLLKCVTFLLAGMWLILNAADNRGYDYPLIRKKYLFLLAVTPLVLAEAAVQALFFLKLDPNVITSCCGALFSPERSGVPSWLGGVSPLTSLAGFYLGVAACLCAGMYYRKRGKGGYLFSLASSASFLLSAVALVSIISMYVYELPSHRCPFCLLHGEYGYVGYLLYTGLLGGGVTGAGVGLLMPYRKVESLAEFVPAMQRGLAQATMILYFVFATVSTLEILLSDFRMGIL